MINTKHNQHQWHPMPRYILRKAVILEELNNILNNKKSVSIIEIGYGSGDMLVSTASIPNVSQVTGFDISNHAKNEAKYILNNVANNLRKKIILQSNLPKNKQFDILMSFEVLEHIKDDISTLKQWFKVLNNNGFLLISVPAHMKAWTKADDLAGHYRRYERDEIITKLKKVGFKKIRIYNYAFPLSIVTDKLSEANFKKKFKHKNLKKKEYTKLSGTLRKTSWLTRIMSNRFVLYPFIILQKLFKNSDLGTAYFIVCQK